MSIVWVDPDTPLPSPEHAGPEGLVAAGLDLGVERILEAYGQGMFPWYSPGDPVLWWCPDPRMVLHVREFRLSHSMRKKLRQIQRRQHDPNPAIQVTCNQAFDEVIARCADTRMQSGTWISPEIRQVYGALHRAGFAHSIETWMDGKLAGGLYGMNLGRLFFGESMFALRTDASKIALAHLVDFLTRHQVFHVDCQQETEHLASLGARPIPRGEFLDLLRRRIGEPRPPWSAGRLVYQGEVFREPVPDELADGSPPSHNESCMDGNSA